MPKINKINANYTKKQTKKYYKKHTKKIYKKGGNPLGTLGRSVVRSAATLSRSTATAGKGTLRGVLASARNNLGRGVAFNRPAGTLSGQLITTYKTSPHARSTLTSLFK